MQLLRTRMGVTEITSIARTLQSELTTRLFACRSDILSRGQACVQSAQINFGRAAAMDLRYVSDGLHLDRKDMFAREAQVPSWLSTDSQPPFSIDTGDNSAGNGGDGYFAGGLVDN